MPQDHMPTWTEIRRFGRLCWLAPKIGCNLGFPIQEGRTRFLKSPSHVRYYRAHGRYLGIMAAARECEIAVSDLLQVAQVKQIFPKGITEAERYPKDSVRVTCCCDFMYPVKGNPEGTCKKITTQITRNGRTLASPCGKPIATIGCYVECTSCPMLISGQHVCGMCKKFACTFCLELGKCRLCRGMSEDNTREVGKPKDWKLSYDPDAFPDGNDSFSDLLFATTCSFDAPEEENITEVDNVPVKQPIPEPAKPAKPETEMTSEEASAPEGPQRKAQASPHPGEYVNIITQCTFKVCATAIITFHYVLSFILLIFLICTFVTLLICTFHVEIGGQICVSLRHNSPNMREVLPIVLSVHRHIR